MLFIFLTLLLGIPLAVSNGLGVKLGWYGWGARGATLGALLAPIALVFVPLSSSDILIGHGVFVWFALVAIAATILIWPKRIEVWRKFKASQLRSKRYNARWKLAPWTLRFEMTRQNTKKEMKTISKFAPWYFAILVCPISLMVAADIVFSYEELLLIPALGEWEVFVILCAIQGLFAGVGSLFWSGEQQPTKILTRYIIGCGLASGLFLACSTAWITSWRPSETVRVKPLESGGFLYTIEKTPSRPMDTSIRLSANQEIGLLDPLTAERTKLGDFDRHDFPRLSPDQQFLTYSADKALRVRNIKTGEEFEVTENELRHHWQADSKGIWFVDEDKALFLFDLTTRTSKMLATDVERMTFDETLERAVLIKGDELQTDRLWLVDSATGETRQITGLQAHSGEQRHHRFGSWSPDGRWIVYGERKSDPNERREFDLWLLDLQTGNQHVVGENCFSPRAQWSASGKFLVRKDDQITVWLAEDLKSRVLRIPSPEDQLDEEGENDFTLSWLADTDRLVYHHYSSAEVYISDQLDQGWTMKWDDERRFSHIPHNSQQVLAYTAQAKPDFFLNRRGYSEWSLWDLEKSEAVSTIGWDGKDFVLKTPQK